MGLTERFSKLLGKTGLSVGDHLAYDLHRAGIVTRLKKKFEVTKVDPIGSYARGTAIPQGSDMDLMVVLSRDEVRWGDGVKSSETVLKTVREELADRFSSTDVGKDGQAVVVPFKDGRHIDVVPAYYISSSGPWSYPVYAIPRGDGTWLKTSPQAHNRYLKEADNASGGKLKNVARLIKFWRTCRTPNVPLNSFHVELLLASEGLANGVKSYRECVYDLLHCLARREARALQDPLGVSGLIEAAGTTAKRAQALRTIADSLKHAASALEAENGRDLAEAYRQWNMVFRDEFPSR